MKHALLVSATDLNTWADHRAAQEDLPRLVRRLIQSATQRVVGLSMAAGDGIQQGGWDGLVESTGAHPFVPDGVSADALQRAIRGADKARIVDVRPFDRFESAAGLSLAVEVNLQPGDKSFTDAEIGEISKKVVAAAEKVGASLRG